MLLNSNFTRKVAYILKKRNYDPLDLAQSSKKCPLLKIRVANNTYSRQI